MTRIVMPVALRKLRQRLLHGTSAALFYLFVSALTAFSASSAGSQIITVRSLPIAEGNELSFFPSANPGMANASIALADTLNDLFTNPAKGGRVRQRFYFGTPTLFTVRPDAGTGSTIPVGTVMRSGESFAAIAGALQTINDGGRSTAFFGPVVDGSTGTGGDGAHTNRYGYVMLGRALAASNLYVGASALWGSLGGMDGRNLMYSGSQSLRQSGRSGDYRLGMLKEWSARQSFEALLVHRRHDTSDNVTFADPFWDPVLRQVVTKTRQADNRDRTTTSGVHLQYVRAISDSGWRVGVIFTANRIDHGAIPSFDIANLEGDRGRSNAFNIGAGISGSMAEGMTVAIDAVYEPIRSHLWSLADSATNTLSGQTIPVDGRTIDNRMSFSNVVMRAGVRQNFELHGTGSLLRLELGLQARSVSYEQERRDLVADTRRSGQRHWVEWGRSWGAALRLPHFEIRYAGRLTSGFTRPGFASPNIGVPVPLAREAVDLIAPWPGPATTMGLQDVSVRVHQLSISVPLR